MNNHFTSFLILLSLSLALLFSGCDEKKVNIPEFIPPNTDRVVVIEELTGVRCPNCPGGSAELKRLKAQFGDNIAIIGIHSSILATPYNDLSKFDFRTPFNDEIQDYLGLPIGKPSAYINRKLFPGENNRAIPTIGSWAGYIASELESFSSLEMSAEHSYDSDSRQLDIALAINSKENLNGQFRLTVYLIESGIIDAQLDQNLGIIEDYEHNYVLRQVLTDPKGDPLPDELKSAQTINRFFTFSLPAEDGWWKAENISIVAFVTAYYPDQNNSREILQAVQFNIL